MHIIPHDNEVFQMRKTYTVTIEFTADNEELARQAFEMMRETFCNDSTLRESFSTLQTTENGISRPMHMHT